jgi:CRP-like cAMP-binding protein
MDNLLLTHLPGDGLARLRPFSERVTLHHSQKVVVPGEPVSHFYFSLDCLLSAVMTMEGGESVECRSVGREGMTGIPLLLDSRATMPASCQVPDEAVRVRADIVKEAYEGDRGVRKYFSRYVHAVLVVAMISAACNRLHNLEERLCRLLLTASDGVGSDEVALTHEFVAVMLGVRRAGVTEALCMLRSEGLIDHGRGRITIRDVEGLKRVACECYGVIKDEYERLVV